MARVRATFVSPTSVRVVPFCGAGVWYFPSTGNVHNIRNDGDPFDATVCWVHPTSDATLPYVINISFHDHMGLFDSVTTVPLFEASDDTAAALLAQGYCVWPAPPTPLP